MPDFAAGCQTGGVPSFVASTLGFESLKLRCIGASLNGISAQELAQVGSIAVDLGPWHRGRERRRRTKIEKGVRQILEPRRVRGRAY